MNFGARELLWLCLLAPAGAAFAGWLWRRRIAAQAAWSARGLWDRLLPGFSTRRLAASVALLTAAVLGATLALCQPRWGEVEEEIDRQGVDLVFVLDSSLSMAAPDVRPSRMVIAKSLIRRLVAELPGHRVALIQAEGDSLALTPLTVDSAVIDLLLDAIEPASLPTPGTRLGRSVDEALKLFPDGDEKHRVMVLVSDGEDHGGDLDRQIDRLNEAGVVVHALGVGTLQGAPIPLSTGTDGGYKRDEDDRVVVSKLSEDGLDRLSRETGGRYVRAAGGGVDLAPVVAVIDSMEKRHLEGEIVTTLAERFQWPLGLAVFALLGHLLVSPFRPRPAEETS